jgi:peptidoglycan/LPS O-acetylase OafA/YrhL
MFFTGGHIAVAVFFVISGHVLSAKPLALIAAGELVKLEDNLASALFRRWLRLFIPALCTTFLYMTSWHLFGIWTAYPEHQSNYHDEVLEWYWDIKNFSFIFRGGDKFWTIYNFHLWSIALEFRGSIVIFTTLLAFSRCRRNARLLCEVGLIYYFLYIVEGSLYAFFVSGMLIGDLELLARNDDLPKFFSKYLAPYKRGIFYTLFVVGMYLSGVPSFNPNFDFLQSSPGWYWLSLLKPRSVMEADHKWFYLFWASAFLVASIPRISWLKAFFEMRFNQYLGRISYALYLVHGPVLWTLGDRLYLAAGFARESNVEGLVDWINIWPLPKGGPLGLEPAFLILHVILLPFTLWVAEVVTKLFDKPSIRFAQWAYRKVVAPVR